jgi:hypothetical protein
MNHARSMLFLAWPFRGTWYKLESVHSDHKKEREVVPAHPAITLKSSLMFLRLLIA